MAANEKQLFMARKQDVEYVENALLVSARTVARKSDGQEFVVARFAYGDNDELHADIVFPNGWEPLGFDMYFGDRYTGGWTEGDRGHLFVMKPAS